MHLCRYRCSNLIKNTLFILTLVSAWHLESNSQFYMFTEMWNRMLYDWKLKSYRQEDFEWLRKFHLSYLIKIELFFSGIWLPLIKLQLVRILCLFSHCISVYSRAQLVRSARIQFLIATCIIYLAGEGSPVYITVKRSRLLEDGFEKLSSMTAGMLKVTTTV